LKSTRIRKVILQNIPYLFALWFCLKLGTAYRLAEGANFALKLIGTMRTIPAAFDSMLPGLHAFDWLVGCIGSSLLRILVYFKVKNAKRFRRDVEFGSARWGTQADIKPFVNPVFQNNIILTGSEYLTMDTRPKNAGNARNLNCCIIGSSGSGKTRNWLSPNLLQAHSSYVVVDPRGSILRNIGSFLQQQGYAIKVFNSIDFAKSMHYNPVSYIKTEADILKFVTALIANTKGDGKEGDEFWSKCEQLLYSALLAYIVFECPEEDRNIITLVDLIGAMEVNEGDSEHKNAVDYMFLGLAKRKPNCFAVRQYTKFKLSSGGVT